MKDDIGCSLAWSIFENTGNIEAYLLYHDLKAAAGPDREETSHAMQNRRPGNPGNQCR